LVLGAYVRDRATARKEERMSGAAKNRQLLFPYNLATA
jgi:hypothetical protein